MRTNETAKAVATTEVATTAKAIEASNVARKTMEGIVLAVVTLLACVFLSSCATPSSATSVTAVLPETFVTNDIGVVPADNVSATEGDVADNGAPVTVVDNRAVTFNALQDEQAKASQANAASKASPNEAAAKAVPSQTKERTVPTTTATSTQVKQMADAGCFKVDTSAMNFDFTDEEINGLDTTEATIVDLSSDEAAIDGAGAAFADGKLEITAGGVYQLEGVLDGGVVIVNAPGKDVQLVLHDLTINNVNEPAIQVKAADQAIITLEGDVVLGDEAVNAATIDDIEAESLAADGRSSESADPTVAVISSAANLAINGDGTLMISSANGGGVYCAGTLALLDGTYNVVVTENGFYAVDAVKVADGTYYVDAGEQAFTAINLDDFGQGYVAFEGGTFDVSADEFVETSSFLAITDGTYNLLCTEDAIASDIDMYIGGGQFGIITNGYGFNAEANLITEGGDITDFYGIDTYTAGTLYAAPSSLASDTTYDDPVDDITEYGYYAD